LAQLCLSFLLFFFQNNLPSNCEDGKVLTSTVILTNPNSPPALQLMKKKNQEILVNTGLKKIRGRSSFKRNRSACEERQKNSPRTFNTSQNQYSRVDRFFLFLSPILFIIFNTFYWGYFMC
jgi:hypothetical protein